MSIAHILNIEQQTKQQNQMSIDFQKNERNIEF